MKKLPQVFQIRNNSIVVYNDYSVIDRVQPTERKKIEKTNTFSKGSKKRMMQILNKWQYVLQETKMKKEVSFVTLTLSSKMKDNIRYDLYLKSWLEKIQYRYGKLNYVWKAEYQKNGNLHYHILTDTAIDWKIARSQWNKIQSIHVDEYQNKMKLKYSKGYYFDKEMVNKKNEIVSEEIQLKRYNKGKKCNWRNPNSTDVEIITDMETVGNYIGKYINKKEEQENENTTLKRYWSCNDELRLLKYATIKETEFTNEEWSILLDNKQKEIRDNMYRLLCIITEKIYTETIIKRESEVLQQNRDLITYTTKPNDKLLQKEVKKYDKIFA